MNESPPPPQSYSRSDNSDLELSRRGFHNRRLIYRRIQVREIIVQLVDTGHVGLLGPERIRQRAIIILPHQVFTIEDKVGGDSIVRHSDAISSEAHREDLIGGGTNVEQGVRVESHTRSGGSCNNFGVLDDDLKPDEPVINVNPSIECNSKELLEKLTGDIGGDRSVGPL